MSYTDNPLRRVGSAAIIGALVLAVAACGERASNETAPTGLVADETSNRHRECPDLDRDAAARSSISSIRRRSRRRPPKMRRRSRAPHINR